MTSAVAKLRTDLEISRQQAGTAVQVVVRDPSNGGVYSFPEQVFALLGSADGQSNTQQVADAFFGRCAEPAECEQVTKLFAKAQGLGLLSDGAVNEPAAKRGGVLMWRLLDLPLGQRFTTAIRPLGALFGIAAIAAFALIAAAGVAMAGRIGDYGGMLQVFFQYAFWPETIPLLLLSMVWHEVGHLAAAKRYGAGASRVGAGFYLFMPAAYVSIEDFFMIPQRWQRAVVALGGVYFDLMSASIAILVWANAPNYSRASQIGVVVSYILLCRIVFNLLPFLRMDGYWAFTESLGLRKLKEEAYSVLLRAVPGLRSRLPVSHRFSARARWVLAIYGIASTALLLASVVWSYRFFARHVVAWWPGHALAAQLALAIAMGSLVAASLVGDLRRTLALGVRHG